MRTHADPQPMIPVLGIYVSEDCDVHMLAALFEALSEPFTPTEEAPE